MYISILKVEHAKNLLFFKSDKISYEIVGIDRVFMFEGTFGKNIFFLYNMWPYLNENEYFYPHFLVVYIKVK